MHSRFARADSGRGEKSMPLAAPCCGQIASRRWRSQLRVAGIRYTTCRRVQEIVGSRRRACFFGLGFRRGTFFPVSESKTGGANAFIGGRSIRLVSYNEASTSAAGCPESDDATRAYSDCSPAHRITSGYTLRSSLRCGARNPFGPRTAFATPSGCEPPRTPSLLVWGDEARAKLALRRCTAVVPSARTRSCRERQRVTD